MAGKIFRVTNSMDILFYVLLFIGVAQLFYYYPLLPEMIVGHFSYNGNANGSMTKQLLLILNGIILFALYMVYYYLIRLNLKNDQAFISLPNKEYWLDDVRRSKTTEYISRKGRNLTFYTLGFMMLIMQVLMEANLSDQPRLDSKLIFVLVMVYGLYVTGWSISFIIYFRKTD